MKLIRIRPEDNVAVALSPIDAGEMLGIEGLELRAIEAVPQGHKIALRDIPEGAEIVKYGYPIGHAVCDIPAGSRIHTHNCATDLKERAEYSYTPKLRTLEALPPDTFEGYLHEDGRAAVRNEIWILPTVGCVNGVAEKLAQDNQRLVSGTLEGIHAFTHPYGCSQLGDDHAQTRRLLAALAKHPNATGVLVLGLGCENLTMDQFKAELGTWDDGRVKFLICQDVEDEYAEGARLLSELAERASGYRRQTLPASKLVIGMKCGGSDGLSGVTANPTVGAFSDLLIAQGGSTILTEVPEMFGAETILMYRCVDEQVFARSVDMINGFKDYFVRHGESVYENPSPGNRAGGITTLEDKSLGCVQKGGIAPVVDVLPYGGTIRVPGLNLLDGPGNDLVSATALTAAGAHLILFTTGRGTPFGAPAPTIKISSNTPLYEHKRKWIDFDAGPVANGEPIAEAGKRLLKAVLSYASGRQTLSEENGLRSIAIFKGGITL